MREREGEKGREERERGDVSSSSEEGGEGWRGAGGGLLIQGRYLTQRSPINTANARPTSTSEASPINTSNTPRSSIRLPLSHTYLVSPSLSCPPPP
eukprot:3100732-Rhodomonas_salina.2